MRRVIVGIIAVGCLIGAAGSAWASAELNKTLAVNVSVVEQTSISFECHLPDQVPEVARVHIRAHSNRGNPWNVSLHEEGRGGDRSPLTYSMEDTHRRSQGRETAVPDRESRIYRADGRGADISLAFRSKAGSRHRAVVTLDDGF